MVAKHLAPESPKSTGPCSWFSCRKDGISLQTIIVLALNVFVAAASLVVGGESQQIDGCDLRYDSNSSDYALQLSDDDLYACGGTFKLNVLAVTR